MKRTVARVCAAVVACLALTGDALLLRLQMAHDGSGVLRGMLTDTIFFSDLSNLFVAVVFLLLAFDVRFRLRSWLLGCSMVAVLLTFVGSQGWLGLVRPVSGNTLVHTWTPLCAAAWAICFAIKGLMRWSSVVSWTVACLSYLPYVFLRGRITGRYPYPWLNPHRTTWTSIGQTVLLQCLSFVAISALLVSADKVWVRAGRRMGLRGTLNG